MAPYILLIAAADSSCFHGALIKIHPKPKDLTSINVYLTETRQSRFPRSLAWYILLCYTAIATVTPRKHDTKGVCTGVFVIAGFFPRAAARRSEYSCWRRAGPDTHNMAPCHPTLSPCPLPSYKNTLGTTYCKSLQGRL